CGDDDDDDAGAAATTDLVTVPAAVTTTPNANSAADCAEGNTIDSGGLTIATGDPAFPPYVINDATPEDGQGFEAAVAMAVRSELGLNCVGVAWESTPVHA